MAIELLLIEDVKKLGRAGEIVSVKPGYARNLLIPRKRAVVADKNTKRMQLRLQEERSKKAAIDRSEAEELASKLNGLVLSTTVKVDPEGHMYGSVTILDIVKLLQEKGIEVEKNAIQLAHPIKLVGVHSIKLKLKENVQASFQMKILAEGQVLQEDSSDTTESLSEEGKEVSEEHKEED